MSETIWRATDNDGRCWYYGEKPDWSEHQFYSQDGRVLEYYGTEKPPAGECWEMTVTRRGDIDTDGEPIGWKIVGIGEGGSVLCEKPNGQRRRYSFGDGAKGKPSDEEWERLVNAVADYARDVGIVGPRGERIKEAWKAYEASKPDERKRPTCGTTVQQATIERLAKERDEALRELANEKASGGQVLGEREATIAELQAKLAKPEMPEVVDRFLVVVGDIIKDWNVRGIDWSRWKEAETAVRDHYAPPFRIEGPGVYETEDGNPWEVIYIDPKGGVVARHETTKLLENFHVSGSCKGGNFSLTKYLRPLE